MRSYIYNTINTTAIKFDIFVGLLAPHLCIACGDEGAVMCRACLSTAGDTIPSRCAGCHRITKKNKTCRSCLKWLRARHIYVATSYDSLYERLLHELKFECRKQAVYPIVDIMLQQLQSIEVFDSICPLPTAPSRVRLRGFDHALLISRELSKKSSIPTQKSLTRSTNARQVGANRRERLSQLENEFKVHGKDSVRGKNILLVDDIITTGASIASATNALYKAGAKNVSALVYAQKV
jgi:ComF family protein